MRAFTWAWLLYGILETALAILLPALQAKLSGTAFGHRAEPTLALLASASVGVAVLGSMIARGDLGKSGVVLAAALAAGFALALRSARAGDATRHGWVLASPWVAVPLIVGAAWLLRVLLLLAPLAERLGETAAFAVLWLAAAWFARGALARAWLGARGALRGAAVAAVALGLACAGLLFDAPPVFPVVAARESRLPPVVLVVLDTVRADHLSPYGYARDTTPALADFARGATVFEQMTTPGDMTLTSHASLFTGQFVSRHGTTTPKPVLGDDAETLAEDLARAGYVAFGISSNCGWIGKGHGIDQGFAHWDTRCGRAPFAGVPPVFLRQLALGALRRAAFREQASWRWRSAEEISDEALRAIAHLDASRAPFLLFLNYMDVHRPIQPPTAYRTRYPGADATFDMSADWSALDTEVNAGRREVTPAERAHLVSQYDGALAYLDDQLKRVLDDLRARGLFERSLVIVTSDHGEGFGDHGTFGHGHGVYQDAVHAPLLVKLPGQHDGRHVAAPVSLVDVMPTVLDALALPPAVRSDGISVLGEIPETRPIFAESFDGAGAIARALREGSRKLVVHRGRAPALYDVAADPNETRDLAGAAAEETAARSAALAAWAESQASGAASAEITPEEAERLRALGYLQ